MNSIQKEQKLLTARQIWASKRVYWITSYKALLKYISKDYVDIFKPILTGSKSGTRYYVKDENLQNFVKKFETNQLH